MGNSIFAFLKSLKDQTGKVWGSMSAPQRVTLTMFVVGLVALLVVAGYWSNRPDFAPLCTNIEPEEAAPLCARLKDDNIPFRYEASRGIISVPSGKMDEARLALGAAGLSGSGASKGEGFELFDKTNFGMTDFVQRVNYIRALQGSLERKIAALDGVESAHVTLSIPQDELFVRESQAPKASVEIKARRGRDISTGQVSAVRHLVSAAVPKLSPQNVAVIDADGRLLARFQQTEGDGSSEQLESRMKMERYLTDKVEALLDRSLEPGRCAVQVAVDLGFERIERSTKKIDPESQVTLSESTHTNTTQNLTGTSGGQPGVKANTQGGTQSAGNATSQSQTEKQINNQYSYNTITETVRPEVGGVKRLSVAVLVRPRVVGAGADRKLVPLNEQDLARLTEAVKNAVGFTGERKDIVRVENAPEPATPEEAFAPVAVPTSGGGAGVMDTVEKYLPSLLTAAGLVILALVFWKTMQRLAAAPEPFAATVNADGQPVETNEPVPVKDLQNQVQSLVTQNTNQATDIIRSMLRK